MENAVFYTQHGHYLKFNCILWYSKERTEEEEGKKQEEEEGSERVSEEESIPIWGRNEKAYAEIL